MDPHSNDNNDDMPGYLARNNVTGSAGTTDGPTPFGNVELQGPPHLNFESGPLFAGNQEPGPLFAGNQEPGPLFADNQEPGPLFAGNQELGPSFAGNQESGPSFEDNQEPEPSFAGIQESGLSLAGNQEPGPEPGNMPSPFPSSFACEQMISRVQEFLATTNKYDKDMGHLKTKMKSLKMHDTINMDQGNPKMWVMFLRNDLDGRKEKRMSLMDQLARNRRANTDIRSESPLMLRIGKPYFNNAIQVLNKLPGNYDQLTDILPPSKRNSIKIEHDGEISIYETGPDVESRLNRGAVSTSTEMLLDDDNDDRQPDGARGLL